MLFPQHSLMKFALAVILADGNADAATDGSGSVWDEVIGSAILMT